MRGVMLTVPLVEKEQPIHIALAVLRVNQGARKVFRLQ